MKDNKDKLLKTFIQNKKRIKNFIYKNIRNYEITEDIFHEVFLNAWKGFDNFKYKSSIETWLRKITITSIIAHIRKEQKLFL